MFLNPDLATDHLSNVYFFIPGKRVGKFKVNSKQKQVYENLLKLLSVVPCFPAEIWQQRLDFDCINQLDI